MYDPATYINNSLQSVDQGIESSLGLVVAVVEEGVLTRSPRVLVRDTPDSDADTLRNGKASVHDSKVIVSTGASDIKLSDGNLLGV